MLQITRAPDVPWVGNGEATAPVQLTEKPAAFNNVGHSENIRDTREWKVFAVLWHRLFHRLTAMRNGMRFRVAALFLLALLSAEGFAVEPGQPIVSNVARVPVESSALASVGYS